MRCSTASKSASECSGFSFSGRLNSFTQRRGRKAPTSWGTKNSRWRCSRHTTTQFSDWNTPGLSTLIGSRSPIFEESSNRNPSPSCIGKLLPISRLDSGSIWCFSSSRPLRKKRPQFHKRELLIEPTRRLASYRFPFPVSRFPFPAHAPTDPLPYRLPTASPISNLLHQLHCPWLPISCLLPGPDSPPPSSSTS